MEEAIDLSVDIGPNMMTFPRLAPPGYLGTTEYEGLVNVIGCDTIAFGPNLKDVIRGLGGATVTGTATVHPAAFARTIAKIAYSYVVAENVLDHVDGGPLPLTAILGQTDDIGRWVGTLTKENETHPKTLHRIVPHLDQQRGLLIVEVQLFSDSQTPSYGVIIGRLRH